MHLCFDVCPYSEANRPASRRRSLLDEARREVGQIRTASPTVSTATQAHCRLRSSERTREAVCRSRTYALVLRH